MLSVSLQHRFPGLSLDIGFEAPTPGVVALFGPSGAGKSTVVSAVAGLLRAEHCLVEVDGVRLSDLPVERRGLGLVFQNARLFPHMSVESNLRYGERRAGSRPPGAGFDAVVSLLGLDGLLRRRPGTLSGGEKQRVAIGRALLARPALLLMDEPLASLDAQRRAEILPYLARLRTELRLAMLYVTHALDEVSRLADTLVLIEHGRVRACGPVSSLLGRSDLPVSRAPDAAAVLDGILDSHQPDRGLSTVRLRGGGMMLVPLRQAEPGRTLRLRVPAREVVLALSAPEAISIHNAMPCRVAELSPKDVGEVLVSLALSGDQENASGPSLLLARVTADTVRRLGLTAGLPLVALVKSVTVEILDA